MLVAHPHSAGNSRPAATPNHGAGLRLAFSAAGTGAPAPAEGPETLLAAGFHELLAAAPGDRSTALGLTLSMAAQTIGETGKAVCLCGLAGEAQEHGALYGPGLAPFGIEARQLLMVTAQKEKDLLWTLEEALASQAFGAVIGTLAFAEKLYAFPASRRLKLRACAGSTPLYLIRHHAGGGATAAQGRWRVRALPSRSEAAHAGYLFVGSPRLRLELERMASFRPQSWEMEFDATRGFHLAPLLENGPARGAGKGRRQSA
jgi:protein ImuA